MTTASVPISLTLEPDLKRMETRLLETLTPLANSTIGDRLRALILAGGKRLRPSLTFYAARIFNADPDRALPVAAGIELLHTATLVHDDLVDHAPARRGVPTLNSALPTGLVVLSGDFLFAEAARLVAEADHVGVIRSFARALSEIVHGEIIQAQARYTLVSLEEYYHRIYGKTASLFRTAAETGAMLGTTHQAHIEALSEYGRLLGMAFQIVDDALDFSQNGERIGKPIGNDLRQGIISLPVLIYHQQLEQANGAFKRVISGNADDAQIAATIQAIRNSGAVQDALQTARTFARQAREALAAVPDNPARQALLNLASFAVARDY